MYWQRKKILITGASGFIGSHLIEELINKKATIRAMVHYNSRNDWGNIEKLPEEIKQNIEIISGDIRDPFFIRKAVEGQDVVFHLAALISIPYSYNAPKDFVDTNILGTLNIMQASYDEGVDKIVHTSTSEVYGTALYTPIDESHPLQGQSPYSASKIGADKIAESYYHSFDLPVSTIRPFNTFGPRQSARAVIPSIISQILKGKKEIMIGALNTIRDFTYVKDTIQGFLKIAESKHSVGQVINIGSGTGISIDELSKLIMKFTNDVKIVTDSSRMRPEGSEVMLLLCNNKKAKDMLGWKPFFSFEDGLKETISYINNCPEDFKSNIYNI